MILHSKFDLMNHPKYFIHAVRLLASVSGAASRRLAHHLLFNRTANTKVFIANIHITNIKVILVESIGLYLYITKINCIHVSKYLHFWFKIK